MCEEVHHEQAILLVVPSVIIRIAHVVSNEAFVFVLGNLKVLLESVQEVIEQEISIHFVLYYLRQFLEDLLLVLLVNGLIAIVVPSVSHVLLNALLEVLVYRQIIVELPQQSPEL